MSTRLSEYSISTTPPNGSRVRQLPQSVVPVQMPQQALTKTRTGSLSITEEENLGASLGGLGELVQVVT